MMAVLYENIKWKEQQLKLVYIPFGYIYIKDVFPEKIVY